LAIFILFAGRFNSVSHCEYYYINDVFVHETAIIDSGAKTGTGIQIWHWTHVGSSAVIGQKCNIGQNVFVVDQVTIGNGCKIQNNVSLYKGVLLDHSLVAGNPTKQIGWMCMRVERLAGHLHCPCCGKNYQRIESGLTER